MNLKKELFGEIDKQPVCLYKILNDNGISIHIANYGGIIQAVYMPDKNGKNDDIVLGFDNLDDYVQKDHPYIGPLIGRYANRIGNAQFEINGKTYHLTANHGKHQLHGGNKGFDKVVWDIIDEINTNNEVGIVLQYSGKDGEEGFPGNVSVQVKYALTNDNELIIQYSANTDKPTHVNLTNHSYFNLTGCTDTVLNHEITINANQITEVDEDLIPTGNIIEINRSALDFTTFQKIGDRIHDTDNGYDHNYVLNKGSEDMIFAAQVVEPVSSRSVKVYTTTPGMQFYTGNYLDGSLTGKNGIKYQKNMGLCLETQHFPDTPNQPAFPSTLLLPGAEYKQVTLYKFDIDSPAL
jgi:aldose 1-epimerase